MLVMGFALLLLLLDTGQIIYRYTLPTDGWSIYTEEIVESIYLFDSNLVGAPSDLQTADGLLAVDNIPLVGRLLPIMCLHHQAGRLAGRY